MVDESIRVLELPRMFNSVEELDYVADKMWPYFVKKFEAKGFTLRRPRRGRLGLLHVEASRRASTRSRARRCGCGATTRSCDDLYKKLGVSGVPLGVPEVEPALTTGRIDACYGSPLAAVALQWNTKVKYMTSMPISYASAPPSSRLDSLNKISAPTIRS
jgi:TRAP-type C4-dicarboxylate transport system substrate-binding protein